MFRRKTLWIALLVLALVGSGGYGAYATWLAPEEVVAEETTMQTATVSVGDISITADGSGMLVASSEVNLAFGTGGTLMELLVEVGDEVQAGDVLAWIDDTDARKAVTDAELQVAQAEATLAEGRDLSNLEQSVAQAEIKVAQAEASLASAQLNLDELLTWEADASDVKLAEANLSAAWADYQEVVARSELADDQITSTRVSLEQAITDLAEAQAYYRDVMDAARDWDNNIGDIREAAAKSLAKAEDNLEIAQANYNLATIDSTASDIQNAWSKVLSAQVSLENAQTGPEESDVESARIQVQQQTLSLEQAVLDLEATQRDLAEADTTQAELSLEQAVLKLEAAQRDLEDTVLSAPIAGTVVAVNAEPGEMVNGTAIVLADLGTPVVQFWVEESDLNSVAVGNAVHVVFEALPDLTYDGQIVRVDPVLVTVDGTPAVQAWASVDTETHPVALLGDMNADVEIVAGEALNATLVPVQALRELGEGQYAVFVVGTDGELELRPVEVGLMDYVNAEVRSGLARGEVVSTGETTSGGSTNTSTTDDSAPPADGMMIRMLGG
jgi:RND family efflux transporter MFP subunit